jgi:hypothetical protein
MQYLRPLPDGISLIKLFGRVEKFIHNFETLPYMQFQITKPCFPITGFGVKCRGFLKKTRYTNSSKIKTFDANGVEIRICYTFCRICYTKMTAASAITGDLTGTVYGEKQAGDYPEMSISDDFLPELPAEWPPAPAVRESFPFAWGPFPRAWEPFPRTGNAVKLSRNCLKGRTW